MDALGIHHARRRLRRVIGAAHARGDGHAHHAVVPLRAQRLLECVQEHVHSRLRGLGKVLRRCKPLIKCIPVLRRALLCGLALKRIAQLHHRNVVLLAVFPAQTGGGVGHNLDSGHRSIPRFPMRMIWFSLLYHIFVQNSISNLKFYFLSFLQKVADCVCINSLAVIK